MRFGILGTANIARHQFVPAIRKTDHEVAGVASRDTAVAEAFASDLDIPSAFGSYEDLLAADDIDAVYVPLPNALHATWTKRAADHDLHVLCEKPLAVTASEAREMGSYCRDRGVTLMEAAMYRYHPRTERVQEIVRTQLGEIHTMTAVFHSSFRNWPAGFRFDPDLGGGSLLDVGYYTVNAARTFIGEPERVYAISIDRADSGVDTQTTAILEFEDGATATVSSSFDNADVQYYRLEGGRGWLSADPAFAFGSDFRPTIEYGVEGRTVTEEFDAVNHYAREIEYFVECVESGRRPRTDAEEAARTLTVVDAVRESAKLNRPVTIELVK